MVCEKSSIKWKTIPILIALFVVLFFVNGKFSSAVLWWLGQAYDKNVPFEIVLRINLMYVFLMLFLMCLMCLYVFNVQDVRIRFILYFALVVISIMESVWIIDHHSVHFKNESSSITFFTALMLMLSSVAAFLNLLLYRIRGFSNKRVYIFWSLILLAFLWAGLDEFFMFHEKLARIFGHENWKQDAVTGSYVLGAVIFVLLFKETFKKEYLIENRVFYKTFFVSIFMMALAVFFDSFDKFFDFMYSYTNPNLIFNSIEEVLEFVAASTFFSGFVINLLEQDEMNLFAIISQKFSERNTNSLLKKIICLAVGLIVASTTAVGFILKPEPLPIIMEKDYEVSVFADARDGLRTADDLIYHEDFGLILGNDGGANILLFDMNGSGRVLAGYADGVRSPEGLAVFDSKLFVADDAKGLVWEVDGRGVPNVYLNKGLKSPEGLAFDKSGNLYVADETLSAVIKYSNGHPEILASSFDGMMTPEDMTFDDKGNLYVTDEGAKAVFKIDRSKEMEIFLDRSDGLNSPEAITFYEGNLYVTDSLNGCIYRYDLNGNGGKIITFSRKHRKITGIAFDNDSNLFAVASDKDRHNNFIFKIKM